VITFNPEFTIGTIIIVISFIAVMGGFYYVTRSDMAQFKKDFGRAMTKIEENLDKLNKVMLDVALSNARQDNYEKRTDETFGRVQQDIRDLKKDVAQMRGRVSNA
jgi:uncharacterized membrane protein